MFFFEGRDTEKFVKDQRGGKNVVARGSNVTSVRASHANERLDTYADVLMTVANRAGMAVSGQFNNQPVTVQPNAQLTDIYAQVRNRTRRHSMPIEDYYLMSPKEKRAALKQSGTTFGLN